MPRARNLPSPPGVTPADSRSLQRRVIPLLIGGGALLLTLIATTFLVRTGRASDHWRFQNATAATQYDIEGRLDAYVALLKATAAAMASNPQISRTEFARYASFLDLRERYRGIQGIGFTRRVTPGDVAAVEQEMRRGGIPEFRVWPDTARDEYTAIIYLEPFDRRNRQAIGFDMSSEVTRRTAMHRARDSGRAALSGRVTLVQEIDEDRQPGFLIYLPLYRDGVTPPTVEARREALLGYVYAPFRAHDLFTGIFGIEEPRVDFAVYDGNAPEEDALLFDSGIHGGGPNGARDGDARRSRALMDTARTMDFAGHRWTITYRSTPRFDATLNRFLPWAVGLAGVMVSLVVFLLAHAQMRAAQSAAHSQGMRTRFFAAMSHELRTPVNAIIGYNDLLLAGAYGPVSPAFQQALDRSQAAARHLAELVSDVLDMSKLEAGKLDIDIQPVNVMTLLGELAATIEPMAESHGSTVELACAGALPIIESDPRRIRQIMLNLLSNAARFGERRPITVRCRRTRRDGIEVDVVDQGMGIAEEDQMRIFEEFVQLPHTAGGTGLGLAISRRLAQLLGGELSVTSRPGHGSCFRLRLPPRAPGSVEPTPLGYLPPVPGS
jgi:signal transduction histidine kinase